MSHPMLSVSFSLNITGLCRKRSFDSFDSHDSHDSHDIDGVSPSSSANEPQEEDAYLSVQLAGDTLRGMTDDQLNDILDSCAITEHDYVLKQRDHNIAVIVFPSKTEAGLFHTVYGERKLPICQKLRDVVAYPAISEFGFPVGYPKTRAAELIDPDWPCRCFEEEAKVGKQQDMSEEEDDNMQDEEEDVTEAGQEKETETEMEEKQDSAAPIASSCYRLSCFN
ncbi:hypothetical protein BCR43DRAFT_524771 [Syncephalastrum racemosum]|uniref:Uncharacterized protein n=1 Tax=Syncephalastrum racemosum TaxID=13706 RepID=A0A1X2HD55_SYNRA|nr:hypothetical protein BCR43DRAFT_524771 [Syncephalastrum racemosum]